jgi:hypothetical protein
MTEQDEALDLGVWADGWDFWNDTAKLRCVGYSAAIDADALAVLRGIAAGKFCDDIAAERNLPRQYVELLQSVFCSVGWADYGSSPRVCFIDPDHKPEELISAFEAYVKRRWEHSA